MLFNDIDMSEHMRIIDVRGRGLANQELTTVRPAGSSDYYVTYRTIPKRFIEVDYEIRAKNKKDLRKKIDEVSALVVTTENVPVIFSDEPDMTYFVEYAGAEEDIEHHHVGIHRGTFFLLRDKYKYGSERTLHFPSDIVTIENNGTADASPIFELTAKKKATFAMISNDEDEYNMIGNIVPIDETPYEREELVLHDDCTSLTGWTDATYVDNGYVDGNIKVEKGAFVLDTVGSAIVPHKWQGPSIKRPIGTSLDDFRMDVEVELLNVGRGTGMLEIYLLDAAGETVMKIGIEDRWENVDLVHGKFQLGPIGPDRYNYTREAKYPPAWNNFKGVLKIFRSKGRIRPYFSLIDGRGRHVWTSSAFVYTDLENKYQDPITQVQIAMRVHAPTDKKNGIKVKDIKFWRYNEKEEGVPYILDVGDVVILDGVNDDIYLNGEPRNDLKNFGGSFFTLKKGLNRLVVTPADSFDTLVRFREPYR